MGTSTEELSTTPAEIEQTRANLSRDIDELSDKVSPGRVVQRRKEAARGRIGALRDKVMGSAPGPGAAGDRLSSAGHSVGSSASGAVDTLQQKAEGNPLAAGVLAFGAGMVLSALLPATEKEAQAASRAVDAAKQHGVADQAKSVGQDVAQDLTESAKQSAQEVAESAKESAETVRQEGRSSAENIRDQATSS
jgi:hypothetical protein